MATPEVSVDAVDRVALTLLRHGLDTRAARVFNESVLPTLAGPPADSDLLGRLADALRMPADERRARFDAARSRAAAALEVARTAGHRFVSVLDPEYPPLLRHIVDPPLGLWMAGTTPLDDRVSVAVVGSRNALPASLMTSRRLARGLAEAGLAIVSGLARGVDEAAHRGALEAGGRTIAVLGSGLDVIYPPEHAGLAREVSSSGALMAELPPGTRPIARHFPMRNRIISGLSQAVIVVEASEKSGSLITARAALEQGRDVLAVPGNVVSGCHRGCHALIKDGARLVETVDDVLEELGWKREPAPSAAEDTESRTRVAPDPLLAIMRAGEPINLDDLARRTGRRVSSLLADLSRLELAGHVERAAGGAYLRVDTPATNR